MNIQQQHDFLLEHWGSVPEHYTLYPLPDDKHIGRKYSCIGIAMDCGRVLIFEFGFVVPGPIHLPFRCFEDNVPHNCETCEKNMVQGEPKCPIIGENRAESCHSCGIAQEIINHAAAEYYRNLHEKHYGKISVSV